MNRQTQALLMAFLGAVLLRLALTDTYLRYVNSWMKWPVVASGLLLLVLAAGQLLGDDHDDHGDHEHADGRPDDGHDHRVPAVTWLLALPGLVVFVVSPPQLGSYLAERRAEDPVAVAEPDDLAELNSAEPVPVDVTEFIWRAQEGGTSLEGQPVTLTGFVSYGAPGTWYVTRLVVNCCAADATPHQVEVTSDEPRPPRDQWLQVTGTYVAGSGADLSSRPVLAADTLTPTKPPAQTYE